MLNTFGTYLVPMSDQVMTFNQHFAKVYNVDVNRSPHTQDKCV